MSASAWAGHRQQQRHSYTREHVHIGQSRHELVQASRSDDEHVHAMSWCASRSDDEYTSISAGLHPMQGAHDTDRQRRTLTCTAPAMTPSDRKTRPCQPLSVNTAGLGRIGPAPARSVDKVARSTAGRGAGDDGAGSPRGEYHVPIEEGDKVSKATTRGDAMRAQFRAAAVSVSESQWMLLFLRHAASQQGVMLFREFVAAVREKGQDLKQLGAWSDKHLAQLWRMKDVSGSGQLPIAELLHFLFPPSPPPPASTPPIVPASWDGDLDSRERELSQKPGGGRGQTDNASNARVGGAGDRRAASSVGRRPAPLAQKQKEGRPTAGTAAGRDAPRTVPRGVGRSTSREALRDAMHTPPRNAPGPRRRASTSPRRRAADERRLHVSQHERGRARGGGRGGVGAAASHATESNLESNVESKAMAGDLSHPSEGPLAARSRTPRTGATARPPLAPGGVRSVSADGRGERGESEALKESERLAVQYLERLLVAGGGAEGEADMHPMSRDVSSVALHLQQVTMCTEVSLTSLSVDDVPETRQKCLSRWRSFCGGPSSATTPALGQKCPSRL